MKNNSNLSNETIACIRTNVRKFLKDFKQLSKYRINKIIKAEIDDPKLLYIGDNNETREDMICRYYNTVGNDRLLLNYIQKKFMDGIQIRFGINLKDYV